MSADLFQFIIEGNLGLTPELRHTHNGTAVTDLRVAVNRSYTNGDGERVENTHWHKVTVWGRQAETCAGYLTKGRRVRVHVGRIDSEAWNASNPETGATEIAHRPVLHASRVDFLPGGTRTDSPSYAEDADMMGVEAPEPAVPAPVSAAPKAKSRRKKATAPASVPAGYEDFADLDALDIPF